MPTNNVIAELSTRNLTTTVNAVKPPNKYIHDQLFSNHHTNPGERISIETIVGGRKMAPFTMRGAAAKIVDGLSSANKEIEAPNIRIKRPFSCDQMVFRRQVGGTVYVSDKGSQVSLIQRAIARDVQYTLDQIRDTLEWMCCQALTGTVTYNMGAADDTKGDWWTVDFGRPGTHTVTQSGTGLWDNAACDIGVQVDDVKRLFNIAHGLNPTDCYLGRLAATAFRQNVKLRADLNVIKIDSGFLQLQQQFQADGAIWLGRHFGIDFWEYARQVTDPFGNTVDLLHQKKAHYVCKTPAAENVVEYGAIADYDAEETAGLFEGELFSKSWRTKDPSVQWFLAHSRPLPVPRRPDTMATHQVLA